MNKSFESDLKHFISLTTDHTPFSLSRFGDGELSIIKNIPYNASRHHGAYEFTFDGSIKHDFSREQLIEAYKYTGAMHYTGIICPCCSTLDTHLQARQYTNAPGHLLTWANIFVNSNSTLFYNEMLPVFSSYKNIILVCNKIANYKKLPFSSHIKHIFTVGNNAWLTSMHIVEKIKHLSGNIKDALFIVAAGPLSNVIVMTCHQTNPLNTYIDIGSVLDPFMIGKTRGYHKNNNKFHSRVCTWE